MLSLARQPMTVKTEMRTYEVECSTCGFRMPALEVGMSDDRKALERAEISQIGHAHLHIGHHVNIYKHTNYQLIHSVVDQSETMECDRTRDWVYADPVTCRKCGGVYDEASYCNCPIIGKGA